MDADQAVRLASDAPERVTAALAALDTATVRNPAGWVVAAVTRGWDLPTDPAPSPQPAPPPRPPRPALYPADDDPPAADPTTHPSDDGPDPGRDRAWADAASAVLADGVLARLVAAELDGPLAGFAVTSPRILRARVAGRIAGAHLARPDLDLADAVTALGDDLAAVAMPEQLPPCPAHPPPKNGLQARLEALLTSTQPGSARGRELAGSGVGHG